MGVQLLIGRPGSGKSYEATRRALWEADRDRMVFSNYAIKHPNCYMFGPNDLLDLPRGVVIIDEAHLWFPARMSLKLPMSWLTQVSQTRKSGWDLLLVAQHETRLDRALRDVAEWAHLCRAWFSYNDHPVLFTTTTWEPEAFRKPKRQLARGAHLFSQRVADAYNTHERLVQADHTHDPKDQYASRRRGGSVLEGAIR
jgi:zona occludens toxin (predicted ATPase)